MSTATQNEALRALIGFIVEQQELLLADAKEHSFMADYTIMSANSLPRYVNGYLASIDKGPFIAADVISQLQVVREVAREHKIPLIKHSFGILDYYEERLEVFKNTLG